MLTKVKVTEQIESLAAIRDSGVVNLNSQVAISELSASDMKYLKWKINRLDAAIDALLEIQVSSVYDFSK